MIERDARQYFVQLVQDVLSKKVEYKDAYPVYVKILNQSEDQFLCETISLVDEQLADFVLTEEFLAENQNKKEWDNLQRHLLALAAGATISQQARCQFHPRQLVALAGILAIISCFIINDVASLGLGMIGSTFLSWFLFKWYQEDDQRIQDLRKKQLAMAPFQSLSQLEEALNRAPQFKKIKFPQTQLIPRKSPDLLNWTFRGILFLVLFLAPPVQLLFFLLPDQEDESKVIGFE